MTLKSNAVGAFDVVELCVGVVGVAELCAGVVGVLELCVGVVGVLELCVGVVGVMDGGFVVGVVVVVTSKLSQNSDGTSMTA